VRFRTNRERLQLLLAITIIVSLAAGYVLTSITVTVAVDGQATTVRTHHTTVADLLAEMGIEPQDNDAVSPSPSSPLYPGSAIQIERVRHVTIAADGLVRDIETHAETPAAILNEYGVSLRARDRVFVNNRQVDPDTLLSQHATANVSNPLLAAFSSTSSAAQTQANATVAARPSAVTITIQRAVAVTIAQDGVVSTIMTAARTVGEALFSEGIYIYAADIVTPSLERAVAAGLSITIRRARPLTITADGRTFATRTQAETVAAVMAQEGIGLDSKDYSTPALTTTITSGMSVQLTRVREETVTESESIAFATVHHADSSMELDQTRVATPGKPGVRKRTTRIIYENGKEVRRFVEREWIDEPPVTQAIAYGTRIIVRTAMTPDGPIEYWRALRVWATYYTAATSGKARDHPQYGITRTGIWATKGVIAVDPDVIRLHTPMYVPGYGFGAAEDTGGLILGMHIDLAYDDDDPFARHYGWLTIYLLTPVPADIPWVLPDFPSERR
jgi:uncharacterized protein YabE (DUF348 family)